MLTKSFQDIRVWKILKISLFLQIMNSFVCGQHRPWTFKSLEWILLLLLLLLLIIISNSLLYSWQICSRNSEKRFCIYLFQNGWRKRHVLYILVDFKLVVIPNINLQILLAACSVLLGFNFRTMGSGFLLNIQVMIINLFLSNCHEYYNCLAVLILYVHKHLYTSWFIFLLHRLKWHKLCTFLFVFFLFFYFVLFVFVVVFVLYFIREKTMLAFHSLCCSNNHFSNHVILVSSYSCD